MFTWPRNVLQCDLLARVPTATHTHTLAHIVTHAHAHTRARTCTHTRITATMNITGWVCCLYGWLAQFIQCLPLPSTTEHTAQTCPGEMYCHFTHRYTHVYTHTHTRAHNVSLSWCWSWRPNHESEFGYVQLTSYKTDSAELQRHHLIPNLHPTHPGTHTHTHTRTHTQDSGPGVSMAVLFNN